MQLTLMFRNVVSCNSQRLYVIELVITVNDVHRFILQAYTQIF